jgi:hypothetical protein
MIQLFGHIAYDLPFVGYISSMSDGLVIPEKTFTLVSFIFGPHNSDHTNSSIVSRIGLGMLIGTDVDVLLVRLLFDQFRHIFVHLLHCLVAWREERNNIQIVFIRGLSDGLVEIRPKGCISYPCSAKGAHIVRVL